MHGEEEGGEGEAQPVTTDASILRRLLVVQQYETSTIIDNLAIPGRENLEEELICRFSVCDTSQTLTVVRNDKVGLRGKEVGVPAVPLVFLPTFLFLYFFEINN